MHSAARRAQPEAAIQRAVFEHFAVRGADDVFAFHPANGGWRSPAEAAILKGLGVRAGRGARTGSECGIRGCGPRADKSPPKGTAR
jgi:hypothetical protein